jgi:1-acyl-sn-glycerol-3-phosphate acyltransferase
VPIAHPDSRAYRALAAVVRPILFALSRRRWSGGEHIPQTAGCIIVANHATYLDALTFAHFVWDNGRAPRILAKSSLFRIPVLGAILRATGMIPVYRNSSEASKAIDEAVIAIADGLCVAIFPEGTLTREPDLWPMAGRTGAARLALATRAPVVPIAQWGAQNILARYGKLLKPFPRKTVTVRAGAPVDLGDLYDRPRDTVVLREATERMMTAITALLEDIRGESAPAERFDMRKSAGATRKEGS